MRFKNLFKKKRHPNPVINDLYKKGAVINKEVEKIVLELPNLAEAIRQGRQSLLQKSLLDQISEYDHQTGRQILKEIDEDKKEAMIGKLTAMMLLSLYDELSSVFKDTALPSSLTLALHYEIYRALPSNDGFVEYLDYQNPHFEDPKMAPAHKFANDIAEILSISDQLFYFVIAQQVAVISEVSRKLIRWVLFDEAIESSSLSS